MLMEARFLEYLQEVNEKFIDAGKVIPEFNYYVMDLNALFESTLYVYYVDAPAKGDMDGGPNDGKIPGRFRTVYERSGSGRILIVHDIGAVI